MTFIGRLRRGSALHRLWRDQRRVGGLVEGVAFHYVQGDNYETDGLASAAVVGLQSNPDVELVTIGTELPARPPLPRGRPRKPEPAQPAAAPTGSFASQVASQRERERNGLKVW